MAKWWWYIRIVKHVFFFLDGKIKVPSVQRELYWQAETTPETKQPIAARTPKEKAIERGNKNKRKKIQE